MSEDAHTLATAREAAARDELEVWIASFLASPGSDNADLADQLVERALSWLGPVEIPLDQLFRMAGPRGHPVMRTVDDDEWRDDVAELAEEVDGPEDTAPVVATFVDGMIHLEDGNHRVEALRRAGAPRAWTVIGFPTESERDAFVARSEGSAAGR